MPEYLKGRGALLVADRDDNGDPGALTDVGENIDFVVEIEKSYVENYSTRYAEAERDLHVPVRKAAKITFKLKEAFAAVLELALHGTKTALAGGSLSAQAFPSGIVAGETHRIPGAVGKVSGLSIVDSNGTPATLTLNTHYTVDLVYGTVKFLNLASFTQPFKASFTNAAATRVSLLTKRVPRKYLRLQGINITNEDRAFLAEFYNCDLMPAKQVQLKDEGETVNGYEMEAVLIADPTKAEDPVLGRYGNYLDLGE